MLPNDWTESWPACYMDLLGGDSTRGSTLSMVVQNIFYPYLCLDFLVRSDLSGPKPCSTDGAS